MEAEFTKLSSKGQVVIPQNIRETLHLTEGTPFAVTQQGNAIILKKIEIPKIKSWKEVTKPFREAAHKSRLTQADVEEIIIQVRKAKMKR
jgi:antitoxin PrlF